MLHVSGVDVQGQVVMEYKATGRQLEVPPGARGIPFDEWLIRQPLCEPGAVAKWYRDRDIAINAKAALRGKSGKRKGDFDGSIL